MLYWIWLTGIKGLGPKRQRILLEEFGNPENIYKASLSEVLECDGIGDKTGREILEQRCLERSKIILDSAERTGIELLTLDNKLYPDKAKSISQMPIVLYYKGNLIENSMGVGIVGARRCSDYGKMVANDAARYLANENISVVSGMAKGIDGYAHISCLKADGYTVAILGNGLDICYPPEHMELMEKIMEKGVIISEYPPGTRPNPRNFPRRNLIISAWSHKILVVEAGIKSGSLITADYGKEHGREVLALPDNIYRAESMGSNNLILQGAIPYIRQDQLLIKDRYKARDKDKNDSIVTNLLDNLEGVEKEIYKIILTQGTKTSEELSFILNVDNMELIGILALMELEGKIFLKGSKVNI